MATNTFSGQNGKKPEIHWMINIKQDFIEFFEGNKPDPNWSYTDDGCGKEHRWAFKKDGEPKKRQSWKWVEDYEYWCEECHDIHTHSHCECRACGAVLPLGPGHYYSHKIGRIPSIKTWSGTIELFELEEWNWQDMHVPFEINKYIPEYRGQAVFSEIVEGCSLHHTGMDVCIKFEGIGELKPDAKKTKTKRRRGRTDGRTT